MAAVSEASIPGRATGSYIAMGGFVVELSLEHVVSEYGGRIRRAALVLTGNPWDADDLTQETLLVVAKSLDKFQGRSRLFTWLYGILLNLERRRRRVDGTRRRTLEQVRQQPPRADAPPADAALEVTEWKRGLWSHVAELPDGQRQALVLRFSEGLRYDEIAVVLQCPLGTVKSRIYHGLLGLRKKLDDESLAALWPPPSVEEYNTHAN